jgi:hypothetical protein
VKLRLPSPARKGHIDVPPKSRQSALSTHPPAITLWARVAGAWNCTSRRSGSATPAAGITDKPTEKSVKPSHRPPSPSATSGKSWQTKRDHRPLVGQAVAVTPERVDLKATPSNQEQISASHS